MANLVTVVKITHPETAQQIKDYHNGGLGKSKTAAHSLMKGLINYLEGVQGGANSASLDIQVGRGVAVQAAVSGTFTGAPSNGETMTINGITLTAKTSGAVAANGEFNIGGTVTITATNLAATINAMTSVLVSKIVTATSLAGVVTITAVEYGVVGNSITVSESLTNFAFAGSATRLASGADPVANVISFGL